MAGGKGTSYVDVVVNNEEAKKRIKELKQEFETLRKSKRQALLDGNGQLAASLDKECKEVSRQMKALSKEVLDVEKVLANLNKVTPNHLQKAMQQLRREMNGLSRDSEEYIQKQLQIEKIERELATAQQKRATSPWAKGLMFAGGAAAVKLLERYGGRAVEMYSRLDDKMADVMKTTGLTKDQVEQLDAALMKIDTRSSRSDLLDLARIGGKLGLTDPAEVQAFVRAADQVRVALAEDLGGDVEEAIRKIGKLTDIFHLQEELGLEKSILSVASAINALGADSTAGEEYLVEFTNRTAGVAPAAKISIANVMGLGAALDNLGQSAQVGGTTYSQVITGMFDKTAKYAKVAGMELNEFKALLDSDANEAFLAVLDGLNGSGNGLEGIIARLGDLNLKGARSTQVMGALAVNVDMIRERQRVANEEFGKATSVTEEYNTKNNSAQALMEKRRKAIDEQIALFGKKLLPLWSEALGFQGSMLKAIAKTIEYFVKYNTAILTVVGGLTAYITVKKLQEFWSKANRVSMLRELTVLKQTHALNGSVTKSTILMASAKNLLAGNLRAAGQGFKLFFASTGPLGWVVLTVTAITAAVTALNVKLKDSNKISKDTVSINKKAAESYVDEKNRLEQLLRIASDKEISDKSRKRAMEALQDIVPEHIGLINEETIATGEAKKAVDKYCESLLLQAKIQAGREKLVELEKEYMTAQMDGTAGALNWMEKWYVATLKTQGRHKKAEKEMTRISAENLKAWEDEYATRTGNVMDLIKGWQKEIGGVVFGNLIDDEPGDNDPTPVKPDKGKWSLDKDGKYLEQKLELRRQYTDKEIQTEDEYNRRVLQAEIEAYERRLATGALSGEDRLKMENDVAEKRYQLQKSEQDRLDKLLAASLEGGDGSSTKALYDQEKLAYEKRLKELGLFNRDRATMTAQELAALENLEKNHTLKLQKIYVDHIVKESSRKQTEAKRAVNALKIEHNQELTAADTLEKKKELLKTKFGHTRLATIRTNADAEKLLHKYYQQEEQRELERHLTGLLADYTAFMEEVKNTVSHNGEELGLLNPQEVERIQTIIDSLNQQLSSLREKTPGAGEDTEAKVDVLGFSADDWSKLFERIQEGEAGLLGWQMALEAVMGALTNVNSLIVACERRELKSYEKLQDQKKKALENHLNAGLLSQEDYNEQIQAIDEETAAKREELERKQAIREKALSAMQAVINTALGITAALAKPGGPAGIALAAVVGAMGAVQLATILATPIGYEEGGFIDVERQQDGRRFRARNSPDRRGRVDSPTVLVAENGPEYVVPNEGYRNPTIRPVLDVIESARQAGNLRDIDLNRAMGLPVYGRQEGGYTSKPSTGQSHTTIVNGTSDEVLSRIVSVLEKNTKALDRLNSEIDKGIGVKLGGRMGLISRVREVFKQINNSRV